MQETGLGEAVAQRIFTKFFSTLQSDLEQLGTAVNQQDWTAASGLAHTLKGSSSNLRLNKLAAQASKLDLACRGGQSDQAQEIMIELATQVASLLAQYNHDDHAKKI